MLLDQLVCCKICVNDKDRSYENDYENTAVAPPPPPPIQQQHLKCDEFWHIVVLLCAWESPFSLLKVILLPLQLYIMIGGPLLALFLWPVWALINAMVCMGVYWSRDPTTAPCLSTYADWFRGNQLRLQSSLQGGEQEQTSPTLSSPPLSVLELEAQEQHSKHLPHNHSQSDINADIQRVTHTVPSADTSCSTAAGLCNLSCRRMADILALWSIVDILFTLFSALSSFVFVFITFTDADGGIAEGWVAGYVLMLISGGICVVSIVLRIIMIIYCLKYRYRAAARAVLEEDSLNDDGRGDIENNNEIECDSNSDSGAGPHVQAAVTFASKRPLSLKENRTRMYLFLSAVLTLVAAIIMGSFTLHDVLRAQYYLPNSVGNTLHGDTSNERCDPMDPLLCLLPFPSSYYLETSTTTSTGFTVDITNEMLPMLKRGVRYAAASTRLHDGFSVSSLLLWYLSPRVNSQQFISYQNINQSLLLESSTTLLINSHTLELHPHFTEQDYVDYETDKLSYLVPAKSLHYDATYIVVVKDLTDEDGIPIPPASHFQDYLHDYQHNITSTTTLRAPRDAKRYDSYAHDIFPKLEGLGVNLSAVQLVWDFHTASQASLLHNLAPMYNLTTSLVQERLKNNQRGEIYEKTSSTSEQCTGTIYSSKMKRVYYTLNVPWYLTDHSRLLNPTQGKYIHISKREKQTIPFSKSAKLLLQIPCSVIQNLRPASGLMQIGHGLFWDRSFAELDYITEQANQHGWVLWSMDWRGLTRYDLPQFLRLLLHDMSETGNSTLSAMAQGMSDKLAGYLILQHILQEEFSDILQESEFFAPAHSSFSSSKSHSLIPPSELRYTQSTIQVPNLYLGVSLGAIMGAGWNAYAPIHLRSVLIAGGSSFTFLLGRSDIFDLLKGFTDLQFYSRKDLRLGIQLLQLHLDCYEASGWTYSGRYQRELQPGQNASVDEIPSILLQTGVGDSTVTSIAGRILGANLNASLLSPSVEPHSILSPTIAPVANPAGTNILFQVLYKADEAALPITSESGKRTNVHKCIIQRHEITSQYTKFMIENTVIQPLCEQALNNSLGACVFDESVSCSISL